MRETVITLVLRVAVTVVVKTVIVITIVAIYY